MRSSPYYFQSYVLYIKWVKTSWTYSRLYSYYTRSSLAPLSYLPGLNMFINILRNREINREPLLHHHCYTFTATPPLLHHHCYTTTATPPPPCRLCYVYIYFYTANRFFPFFGPCGRYGRFYCVTDRSRMVNSNRNCKIWPIRQIIKSTVAAAGMVEMRKKRLK